MRKATGEKVPPREIVTAVLVDGGFYRKRAAVLLGKKDPEERAEELLKYCKHHIRQSRAGLYRIYYYDCPPSDKVVYHPLTKAHVNLGKSEQFKWMTTFLKALTRKRKVAVRRGETLATQGSYVLKDRPLKQLCAGTLQVEDLRERDFELEITQKGVDMRIGLDIASLAEQRLVNQIVMIASDSDFVPAAKLARRSGIDFILDPMWAHVADSLNEHIDGVRQCVNNKPGNLDDPLHVDYKAKDTDDGSDADEL
ncbi:NYN domain-containing protein [Pseudoglutamicibacter albus]|uniref:NYN domain-containing protein n=1 Tax=Pseudoglutamicibacter albus TaxID=98671 RepID=UPI001C5DB5C0|nr:NYN domain-containing protein [Pseudoglutamicibacter albus]WIK84987.1 NYN domain-containing protein [Pseudoglutamicibacter albus]